MSSMIEERDHGVTAENLSASFTVEQTPKEVFAAINNVRGWWSGDIEGDTEKLGDEFSYRYKEIHYSRQRIATSIPGKKVVWLVLDSYLSFVEDKTEWNGTEVTFEISRKGDRTEVVFTHVGLDSTHECFSSCSDAWGFYVQGSLRDMISKGKGQPNAPK